MNLQVINVDLYKATVIVIKQKKLNLKQLPDNLLTEQEKQYISESEISCHGSTITFGRKQVVFIHKDTIPILVHELFHATEFILDHVGMKHGDDSSEAYAYLLQYLVEQCH